MLKDWLADAGGVLADKEILKSQCPGEYCK